MSRIDHLAPGILPPNRICRLNHSGECIIDREVSLGDTPTTHRTRGIGKWLY